MKCTVYYLKEFTNADVKTAEIAFVFPDGKECYVYRIVVETFIRSLRGKEEVNHIDGDKTNDCLSNLEIVSRVENHNHAYEHGLTKIHKAVPVRINGKIFNSIGLAAKYFNVDKKVIIGKLWNKNYHPYKNAKTIPFDVERIV